MNIDHYIDRAGIHVSYYGDLDKEFARLGKIGIGKYEALQAIMSICDQFGIDLTKEKPNA